MVQNGVAVELGGHVHIRGGAHHIDHAFEGDVAVFALEVEGVNQEAAALEAAAQGAVFQNHAIAALAVIQIIAVEAAVEQRRAHGAAHGGIGGQAAACFHAHRH